MLGPLGFLRGSAENLGDLLAEVDLVEEGEGDLQEVLCDDADHVSKCLWDHRLLRDFGRIRALVPKNRSTWGYGTVLEH